MKKINIHKKESMEYIQRNNLYKKTRYLIKNPNPSVMVSVGSVDLSSKTSIYDGIKVTKKDILDDLTDDNYELFKNNILLDDDTKTVWLIW